MLDILGRYVPEAGLLYCYEQIKIYGVHLKIVNERLSRHGDYRKLPGGGHLITVNAGSNPYRFLITLIHEIAHLVAFIEHGHSIRPHGKEWKQIFKRLMLPLLNPAVFPSDLLPVLASHFINPKASSSADARLDRELSRYDAQESGVFVEELPEGALFAYREKRIFKKGNKRRKRYECLELETKRNYLFQPNARVKPISEDDQSRRTS
ncbi:MAG: SprT-like domain-containing protein [Bacteroidetes bacterium]|jgi:SprT-like family.|nr:SprT-like domain-containing protein [Bacteroidota bacterium]MDA0950577.1 SprT-like domain-containing protein [Bacteroidota bacterium]